MASQSIESKIRGSVLGAAIGDALGAPFEFQTVTLAPLIDGQPWIDDLYPSEIHISAHGVWAQPAPPGTGTDDTRYNWLFLEMAISLGRMPTAHEFAQRYLELYEQPDSVFPGHTARTREQFAHWEGVCRGFLGQTSEQHPGLTPDELFGRSLGLNFPILSGLITLTSAGLLFAGEPEQAYRQAFRCAFFDIGYARESVALLAAALSIAIVEDVPAGELFERVTAMDPLQLGGEFSQPFVKQHLVEVRDLVEDGLTDKQMADRLSATFGGLNTFDPLRTLGTAFLAVLAADDEPGRAMQIAVNHASYDEQGAPIRFEDIDCYAGIAGALGGAIHGVDALESSQVAQVIEANRVVHGIDLNDTIDRFVERFYA